MLCGLEPFKRLFLIHSQLAEKKNRQKYTLSRIASNETHQASERNELRLQHMFVTLRPTVAKLGNNVAETLLGIQIFPNLAARETCAAETNFAARKQEMFLPWSQNHFCFPDTNFAPETYVSQFSHPGKHTKKHCFRNNVS